MPTENKYINKAYLKDVLTIEDGKPITIGEAQRLAKNAAHNYEERTAPRTNCNIRCWATPPCG